MPTNKDTAYRLTKMGKALRFIPPANGTSDKPPYHDFYYRSERCAETTNEGSSDEGCRHPLISTPHPFLCTFYDAYDIAHSFCPSLLPKLSPAFVWDNASTPFRTTQMPYAIPPGTQLDLGTYFNSFYVTVYNALTGTRPYTLFIEFEGNVDLEVYATTVHGEQEILFSTRLKGVNGRWAVLPLPPVVTCLPSHRIGVRFKASGRTAVLHGLHFATPSSAPRPARRLAILIRTYNRKEQVSRLISTLAADESLNTNNVHLIIHDASYSFDVTQITSLVRGMRITLIHKSNFGSSGNLVVLLNELRSAYSPQELEHTVAAILDDDVLLHPESLLRAWFLAAEAADPHLIIVGSFLDRCRSMNIDATVGLYGEDISPDSAMHLQPLRGGDRIDNISYVNLSAHPVFGNIAAFYLLVAKANLLCKANPLPLFLKWDDIDYTATLHSKGAKLAAVPGVAVWHDAFYDCMPIWQEVLNAKHGLIVDMVHLDVRWPTMFATIRNLIIRHLVVYDYIVCGAILDSVDEVLSFPSTQDAKSIFESSQQQVIVLSQLYKGPQDLCARLAPDQLRLNECLASNEPCQLIDGTSAPVVHELFPVWSRFDADVFIKHVAHSGRSMLFRYDCKRHDSVLKRLSELANKTEAYEEARTQWRAQSDALRSNELWNAILTPRM
jgi:GT2 family glycosyltransferase